MRRTNPQAYADWYRQFYGQMQERMQRDADGRESVHSGRSSANDKERLNFIDYLLLSLFVLIISTF